MIVWEDGSGQYAPQKGAPHKPDDPPGSHPYPPSMPGTTDVTKTIPCPPLPPPPQANPGPFPPVLQVHTPEVSPLPQSPSAADIWDRWQKLVINWTCLITWGGGDLDKLTAAIGGNLPIYQNTGKVGSATAIGAWRAMQSAGYDKATAPADLGKGLGVDANDVAVLIGQLNDLGVLARAKGYAGCPPPAQNPTAPPAPPGAMVTAQGWWGNLSPGGKVVTGGVGIGALVLIVRGLSK